MSTGAAGLRRAMGLRTAVSTSTGLAFAALQYLAAAGLVAYVAGDSAWISIGVAGVLALLAWGFFGELNGMFPTAAAIRRYMSGAMDDRVALSITFTYLSTIVLVVAADAFIVSAALTHVLHVPGWLTSVWTLALLSIAVLSNLRGVRAAGWLQDVATTVVLAATLVVSVVALTRSGTGLHTPLQPLHHHSGAGFLESIALGIFLYSAFEWVTTNAEEVRDPKHIHRAMLIAVGILFVVCATMTTAMSHVLTHAQLGTPYPQLALGGRAFGTVGVWFMAAVTAVTALNTFNGGFITASRFVYATAREGSLPPILARLNDRAVPWVPVIGLGVVSFVVSVVVEVVGGLGLAGPGGGGSGARGTHLRRGGFLRAAPARPGSRSPPSVPGPLGSGGCYRRTGHLQRAGRGGIGVGGEPLRSGAAHHHLGHGSGFGSLHRAGGARPAGGRGGPTGGTTHPAAAPSGT